MTAGRGERGVHRLRLSAQIRENKGGSPKCRLPVDFELLLWFLEGVAGVLNQMGGKR